MNDLDTWRPWLKALAAAFTITVLVSLAPRSEGKTISYAGELSRAEELYEAPHLYEESDVLCNVTSAPGCIDVRYRAFGWPYLQRVVASGGGDSISFNPDAGWAYLGLNNFVFWGAISGGAMYLYRRYCHA